MGKRVENIDEASEKKPDEAVAAKPMITYVFEKAIKAYGEDITVIKMRRPVPRDIVEIGNPVIFYPHAEPVRVEHDYVKVVQMAARLSDPSIPSTSLLEMQLNDLVGLAWAMSPFFTPAR